MSNIVVYLRTWVDENDAMVEVYSTPAKALESIVDELYGDQFVQDENGNPITEWNGVEDLDIYLEAQSDRSCQLTAREIR